ncbi:acetyl-CoA C-acetyltransferase [Alteribacillus iranensis]|uniref:acetyl-CoA C-acyltransferase n=1 Tax=Alteribacillus iranensis TaxID=930128 RepID=A0A1I2EPU8_9BACI|nr:acetyl-CoA C-acetyltransferase [Alteribacillus iranensis]SFE94361.1 3-ketoacyl-CoA thiolase [Alteribacillus iranensis]
MKNEAVIVSGARTPVGKARKGLLVDTRPDDLGAITIKETLKRANNFDPASIEDVIIGCAMPEAEQGMNMARSMSMLAGLPYTVPSITVNRFCSSGLQSIAYGAERILSGQAQAIIAGGAESMSLVPMGGHVKVPNPVLVDEMPEYYMSMGHTAEEVAKKYHISREEQDRFAEESQRRATNAQRKHYFQEEIVPVEITTRTLTSDRKWREKKDVLMEDEGIRSDTTFEVLSRLKPVFHPRGTVTAGNSSQMSDGAASVLIMEKRRAYQEGLKPLIKFRSFAVAGVPPEIMGIGPIKAIPKAVKAAGLSMEDIGLYEINEAFASQALQVIRELKIDHKKVNVNGGAIALGHPLGCTGTKLTLTLMYEMRRRKEQFGVVSMCVGGGMGAAGVFELM